VRRALQVVDVGLRVPALPSRALTASPRAFHGITPMPRSSAPPATAATPVARAAPWRLPRHAGA